MFMRLAQMRVNPDKIVEFDRLKQKVQHTFSNIALWKMAVRTYSVVLGQTLG